MTALLPRGLIAMLVIACASTADVPAETPDDSIHMLFWQSSDLLDAEGVSLTAHPFDKSRFEVLADAPEDRPTLWHNPVAVLPSGDGLRIYYQRVESDQEQWVNKRTLCMGLLTDDGFHLPDLGLFEQTWPGPRNQVMQRSPHAPTWGGFNVFQMTSGPTGDLQMLYWDQPAEGDAGAMLARSADGIHWEKLDVGAVFTERNDAYSLVRDPAAGEYLVYQTRLKPWPDKPYPDNLRDWRRITTIRRSADLKTWTDQDVILEPDEADGPAAEFYLLKVFWHVDRYIGLLMKYYADPERPDKHSGITRNEVVFSRDGVAWERPYREAELGLWSYADPFEYRGEWCAAIHHDRDLVLARTRIDGLASAAAQDVGSFRTALFVMPRGQLRLNADCSEGAIDVQLLDASGGTVDSCRLAGIDGTTLPLKWRGGGPGALVGKPAQLKITLTRARVYALTSAG